MGKVMFLRKGGELTVPTPPFPPEPAFYTELVGTYTESQTWTAPEDGWFQIDVFGASGAGGKGGVSNDRGGSGSAGFIKIYRGDTNVIS